MGKYKSGPRLRVLKGDNICLNSGDIVTAIESKLWKGSYAFKETTCDLEWWSSFVDKNWKRVIGT